MFEEIDKLYEEVHRIAKECVNKDVLNENERFCLACTNGAEVKFETNIEGKLQLVTKDEISFYKENGEWKMIIRKVIRKDRISQFMTWKKGRPKVAGMYLRRNPRAVHVVRQDIWSMEEGLVISLDGGLMKLDAWKAGDLMWWYGPIPSCPVD